MATLSESFAAAPLALEQRERRFYLGMAIAIAGIVLAGFGGYILAGISSFAAPWWVHLHAVTYMGWIALYLNQNWLIVRGETARHRVMGRIMAGWMVAMVVIGTALLFASVVAQRNPPIFSAAMLLVMDEINVLVFAVLVAAGLALRRRSDWHRRLMLSATVSLIAPAIGRLTVLTIGFSWPAIILAQLALLGVAGVFDLRTRGRIHPALLCGGGGIAAMGLVVPPLAELPAVISFAGSVAGGG